MCVCVSIQQKFIVINNFKLQYTVYVQIFKVHNFHGFCRLLTISENEAHNFKNNTGVSYWIS